MHFENAVTLPDTVPDFPENSLCPLSCFLCPISVHNFGTEGIA